MKNKHKLYLSGLLYHIMHTSLLSKTNKKLISASFAYHCIYLWAIINICHFIFSYFPISWIFSPSRQQHQRYSSKSTKIIRLLGKQNPSGFAYELFLDEKGEKISKSKGNGITIDQWLEYASPESLSLYMYQNPKRAKKLYN